MTSIDEALMALIAEWSEESCDLAPFECAERLQRILTTRQEVAPVALPHPLGERHAEIEAALKGQTLLLMSRDHINDKKKPLAEIKFGMYTELGVLFCLADTEASMPVDNTTGQTSDARDAIRWKWMWENGAELCRYTDGDGIAGFAIFIGGKRRSLGKTQAETIDAAMQEAGK